LLHVLNKEKVEPISRIAAQTFLRISPLHVLPVSSRHNEAISDVDATINAAKVVHCKGKACHQRP